MSRDPHIGTAIGVKKLVEVVACWIAELYTGTLRFAHGHILRCEMKLIWPKKAFHRL
jgi:hypothetical protein